MKPITDSQTLTVALIMVILSSLWFCFINYILNNMTITKEQLNAKYYEFRIHSYEENNREPNNIEVVDFFLSYINSKEEKESCAYGGCNGMCGGRCPAFNESKLPSKLKVDEGMTKGEFVDNLYYKVNEIISYLTRTEEKGVKFGDYTLTKIHTESGQDTPPSPVPEWEGLLGAYNAEILNKFQDEYLMKNGPGCEQILFPVLEKSLKDFINPPNDGMVRRDVLKSFITSLLERERDKYENCPQCVGLRDEFQEEVRKRLNNVFATKYEGIPPIDPILKRVIMSCLDDRYDYPKSAITSKDNK